MKKALLEQEVISEELSTNHIVLDYSKKWKVHEEFRFLVNDGKVYDTYYVSNLGRIYSVKQHKIMTVNKQGHYYQAHLILEDGKQLYYLVSRLVAQAFIPNPMNYPCVNHKLEGAENKLDNCYLNLEFCTQQYNLTTGTVQERKAEKLRKKVFKFDEKLNLIGFYNSLTDASNSEDISMGYLSMIINHENNKPYNGFYYRYSMCAV